MAKVLRSTRERIQVPPTTPFRGDTSSLNLLERCGLCFQGHLYRRPQKFMYLPYKQKII